MEGVENHWSSEGHRGWAAHGTCSISHTPFVLIHNRAARARHHGGERRDMDVRYSTSGSNLASNTDVSGWVIFFAVAYQTRSVLRFLAKDLIPPVVALTNMFIHLRVGLGWSRTAQETDRSGVQMTSNASMVCVPTIQDRFAQPESYRLGTSVDGK
jgi:hypothetical protein